MQGTARPDRKKETGPEFAKLQTLGAPDWLSPVGKSKWVELIGYLGQVEGLLAEVDREALGHYCEAWQDFRAAAEIIDEWGVVATSEKGGVYQHPAVGIKNKALERMRYLANQFGMTPSARAALSIASNSEQKTETDPFDELMKMRVCG